MLEFTNLTSKPIRRAVFEKLYRTMKPKNFALSVVFASPMLIKKLNFQYRKKNRPANVLSFLLDRNQGELFINVKERDLPGLFVHGCLHLLGHDHQKSKDADIMEALERKILKR